MQQISKAFFLGIVAYAPVAHAATGVVVTTDNTVTWVAVIMGAIALISLTQVFSAVSLVGPRARNLFLGAKLKADQGAKEQTAWIRALDARSIVLVSPAHFRRGERLRVDLSALPEYPEGDTWVEAEVRTVRSLGGDPPSFEIRLKLSRLKEPGQDLLRGAIRHLTNRSRIEHA